MKRLMAVTIWFSLIGVLFVPNVTLADSSKFHTDPSCWTQERFFHAGVEKTELLSQVSLIRTTEQTLSAEDKSWILGPNRAYRFATAHSNAERPDTNTLFVFVERPYLLRLGALSGGVISEVKWINEKLLFFRVWWGRIRATDIIFDVEEERIRLADILEDGSLSYHQFREGCQKAGAQCECSVVSKE